MKKILMVSYLFPPLGGMGVQRVLKFAKYLTHFGWRPVILTTKHPDSTMFDRGLLKDVPGQAEVIRTHTLEVVKAFRLFTSLVDKVRSSLLRRKSGDLAHFGGAPRSRLHSRINNFLFIPDNRAAWIPFAFLAILTSRIRSECDMIFSTSPPFSSHLIGLLAKLILRKPWVADFRDLWVLDPYKKPPTKIHLAISRYMEHRVMTLADRIVTVSEPLSEDLRKAYPDIASEKFKVIPNGYDAQDFEFDDVKRNERFTIGHVGSLHWFSGRTPYHFLAAIAELKKEEPELVKQMRVLFVGSTDTLNRAINADVITKWGLKNTVRFVDFVSHRRAIRYMRSVDVLLFIPARSYEDCGSSRGNISGKLYEYLATGKPILALTEKGPLRDFIRKTGCGIITAYEDTQEIKREILNCYNEFREGRLKTEPDWNFISGFERKTLTNRLVAILNQLTEGARAG